MKVVVRAYEQNKVSKQDPQVTLETLENILRVAGFKINGAFRYNYIPMRDEKRGIDITLYLEQ